MKKRPPRPLRRVNRLKREGEIPAAHGVIHHAQRFAIAGSDREAAGHRVGNRQRHREWLNHWNTSLSKAKQCAGYPNFR
jgi:hypothetical protein